MKHIKLFEAFKMNEKYTDSDIPVFDNHPDWKQEDSWEGNDGDVNFTYVNSKFEIIVEFWDPDNTYTVGFKELGDKYLIPDGERYQAGGLKNMKEIEKAIDDMMTFLEKHTK